MRHIKRLATLIMIACVLLACSDDGRSPPPASSAAATGGGQNEGGAGGTSGDGGVGGSDPLADGDVVTTVQMQALTDSPAGSFVTFGQPFIAGQLSAGKTLLARLTDGTPVRLQVDTKATHQDGSLRHAVLTAELPAIASGERLPVALVVSPDPIVGDAPALASLLATGFAATVELNVSGSPVSLDAGALLGANATLWLSGPLVSEWLVDAPMSDGQSAHPHLAGRFGVRAYAGLEQIRVSVTVENNWSFASGPRNYDYDATVTLGARGTVLSEMGVAHDRQSRWRRVFWIGRSPAVHVVHDRNDLWRSGAVPRYNPALNISNESVMTAAAVWDTPAADLMGSGPIDPYMPGPGARGDIGPLPSWTAQYLVGQDARAFETMVRASEQAASFPVHYRDANTGVALSVAEHPQVALLGNEDNLPACGGDCASPYEPDDAHQPSLAYVPYLLTGDPFHLEELQLWAAYNTFYWGDHGGGLGLVGEQQIRGQAWALRTIAHAAYITPDDHPLRGVFETIVANNIDAFVDRYVVGQPNALGHVVADPWAGGAISFWQDDFFTWMVSLLVDLGFDDATPLLAYKARFAVGRITDPDFCWTMASANWVTVEDSGGAPLFDEFGTLYEAIVASDLEAIRPASLQDAIRSDPQGFLATSCGGAEMGQRMGGFPAGTMIGWPSSPESYSMNIGAALAAAVDADVANAVDAWTTWQTRSNEYSPSLDEAPHWGIVPRRIEQP